MIPKTKNESWIDMVNAFLGYQGIITNVSIRSQLGVLFRSIALENEEVYQAINDAILSRSAKYSIGEDLTKYVEDFLDEIVPGNWRKPATKATTTIRFYGTTGTFISSVVVQKNDTNFRYASEETGYINSDGYLDLNYEAVDVGISYQANAYQIQEFSSAPPEGLDSCTNLYKTVGGSNEETDDELRARLRLFWDKLAAGVPGAIESAAISVPGVRFAKFIDNFPSVGEDTLIVADNYGLISTSLLSLVKAATLNDVRAMGRNLTVTHANLANIIINAKATLRKGYNIENIRPEYDAAVRNYISTNLTFGSQFYPTNFNLPVEGVWAFTEIKLDVGVDPYSITGVEILGYMWASSYNEAPQTFNLAAYYNASTKHLHIDNQQIYIGAGGNYTFYLSSTSHITTLIIGVNASLLPTADKNDYFKFYTVDDTGIKLNNNTLPITRYIQLDTKEESIVNE